MFVSCECCVLLGRGLLVEFIISSTGVLPTVARRVWSRNLVYEEDLAHWRLSRQIQKKNPRKDAMFNNMMPKHNY